MCMGEAPSSTLLQSDVAFGPECCRCDTTGKTPGRLGQTPCPALPAKIFLFPKIRNHDLRCASRVTRRAYRDRHDTWRGMRWTRWCRQTCGAIVCGQAV